LLLGVTLVQSSSKTPEYRPAILWLFIVLLVGVVVASLTAAFMREDDRASSLLGIGNGVLVGLTAIFMKMAWTDIGNRWGEFRVAGFVYSAYFWIAIVTTLVSLVISTCDRLQQPDTYHRGPGRVPRAVPDERRYGFSPPRLDIPDHRRSGASFLAARRGQGRKKGL
jgi:heme exporter protein D